MDMHYCMRFVSIDINQNCAYHLFEKDSSLVETLDFILVYYEVTVLLRRCTFYCNWRTTSFYCIVLYCMVLYWYKCRLLCYKAGYLFRVVLN